MDFEQVCLRHADLVMANEGCSASHLNVVTVTNCLVPLVGSHTWWRAYFNFLNLAAFFKLVMSIVHTTRHLNSLVLLVTRNLWWFLLLWLLGNGSCNSILLIFSLVLLAKSCFTSLLVLLGLFLWQLDGLDLLNDQIIGWSWGLFFIFDSTGTTIGAIWGWDSQNAGSHWFWRL